MWEYSDKVKEHFLHPHNVGELKDANVVVEVGNVACGDALKLYLKIENEIIQDVRFQTYGCGSAIASSSVLTDLIKGKPLDEVKKITNEDIVEILGGLPKPKIHCSVMAQEALDKALKKYFTGESEDKLELGEEIVCKCFKVTNYQIERAVKEHNLKTVEEITDYTKAGGACGKCINDIKQILDEINNKGADSMTNLERIEKIKTVINDDIKPGLQQDGGDIDLIDVENNVVKVRLKGACSGCPMATMTVKSFVEETLKKKVDENIEVEEIR